MSELGRNADTSLAVREDAGGHGAKPGRLSTVAKALDLLELMAAQPREWGVTELARELGLSKSVVHGLLATLRDKDFVVGDERSRRYRLGFKAMTLGADFDLDQELRTVAMPVLKELTEQTGEASYLMVRRGIKALTIARALPATPIHLAIEEGVRVPLHAGASARVILAFSRPDVIESVIADVGLPRLAEQTITARDDLLASLADIRAKGCAYSASEMLDGVYALAAPVFGPNGMVGSLGMVGIEAAVGARHETFTTLVIDHARRLEAALGGSAG